MLLVLSDLPWKDVVEAAFGALLEPPTGPPVPNPLAGRFWFSPLADWVSYHQSISLFRIMSLAKYRRQRRYQSRRGGAEVLSTYFAIFRQVYLERFCIILEAK